MEQKATPSLLSLPTKQSLSQRGPKRRAEGRERTATFPSTTQVFITEKLVWRKTYITVHIVCFCTALSRSCATQRTKNHSLISSSGPVKKTTFSGLILIWPVSPPFSYSTVSASGEIRSKGNLFLLIIFLWESDRRPKITIRLTLTRDTNGRQLIPDCSTRHSSAHPSAERK